MINLSNFNSLIELSSYFITEEKCRRTLKEQRWGKTVCCPECGSTHIYERKDGRFSCADCNHTFSVLSGTIFENTKISLRKWFMAMYLISSHKKGISSVQLAQDIRVTQKTAWFMLHKIRHLYGQSSDKLGGKVEMDEMYLGGKETNKHESKKVNGTQGRSTKTKTPIFGMVEREGEVRALAVENTKAETLMPIVKRYVIENSEVFTDELSSYSSLAGKGYIHSVVHHQEKEYVVGESYTNTIEGFWSQFRRMVYGIYHYVSKKYLQRYIDEEVYRWNAKKAKAGVRFAYMFGMCAGVFDYRDVRMAA